ncbi:FHA domain-containing protein [Bacteroides finegoldii]|uniref:FHA domain-containing protein n=1 Tax=Bacteroides finegoldii TaxID=338188 RepID=UPI0018A00B0C|nr:FHA domain-containing protein [Bacteroides finegoldii]
MKTITIGRSSKCDIVVPYEGVSRIHAEISITGNQYIFKDLSTNGSSLGGRMIHNERLAVSPGAEILLANRIPLPWAQVYAQLPLSPANPYGSNDRTSVINANNNVQAGTSVYYSSDSLAIGWGILAFLIPLAGWIMYFCWRSETPRRASQAATCAWWGFGVGILIRILAMI